MKKIATCGLIIILVFSYYFINRFSSSKELPFYPVKERSDSTLVIGIIGDSWVSNQRLDSLLHKELLEKGFRNTILSSGHPGANTKTIYRNLFTEKGEHSSRFIIEYRPDYCIVIAGVNDCMGQVGAGFYCPHMVKIIKTLLHYKIKPIIVELPDFGIMEMTEKVGFINRKRYKIYSHFTNGGEMENIQTYRKYFVDELISKNLRDSVIQVDFDSVCNDYHQHTDLYENPAHLNCKGREKLVEVITQELTEDLSLLKTNSRN